ncbi:hypothetical protein FF1_027745 [Malus domestica]
MRPIYLVNGIVADEPRRRHHQFREPDQVYLEILDPLEIDPLVTKQLDRVVRACSILAYQRFHPRGPGIIVSIVDISKHNSAKLVGAHHDFTSPTMMPLRMPL